VRARRFNWLTRSRVGASMIASRPRSRSACQALNSLLGRRSGVADMNPLPIKVEAERLGLAVTQRERSSGLGLITEPV
jgi:hypothetical protein